MSKKYTLYMTPGHNRGSDEIVNMINNADFMRELIEPVEIVNKQQAKSYGLSGVPGLQEQGNRILYGSDAINALSNLIKRHRPVSGGNVDGTDFVNVGDDDDVGFDPTRIRDASDFVIPDAPIGRGNDIDTLIAQAQADRDTFDSGFDARGRY